MWLAVQERRRIFRVVAVERTAWLVDPPARRIPPSSITPLEARAAPNRTVRRASADLGFENQSLLGALYGQFDANLVQVENRLGVFISARGERLHIEGPADSVARAREVLNAMYDRLAQGQDLDAGRSNR